MSGGRAHAGKARTALPRESARAGPAPGCAGRPLDHPASALQRAAGNQAVNELLASDGRPLAPALRQSFEEQFGEDLSAVRIHDTPRAADAVRGLAARAVTVGPHIAFGTGRFAPDTRDGKRLLAHELSHVVQQSRGGSTLPSIDGSGPLEADAARAGDAAVNGGGPIAVAGAGATGPAADPDPEKPRPLTAPSSGAPISSTGPPAPMTDKELLAMADKDPIRVEGKAPHQYDAVLSAANRGLIDLDTPAEFERQLRFRIAHGSTEYADSWSEAERWDYAESRETQADVGQAKWDQYVQQRYMQYLGGKASEWEEATERMDRAARVGNAIGKYTVYGVGFMFAAPAIVDLGPVELGKRLVIGKVLAAQTSSGDSSGMGAIVDFGGSMIPSANTPLGGLGVPAAARGELGAVGTLPGAEPPVAEPPIAGSPVVEPGPPGPASPADGAAPPEAAGAGVDTETATPVTGPVEPTASPVAKPGQPAGWLRRQAQKVAFTFGKAMAGAGDLRVAPALAGGENAPYLMRVGQMPDYAPPPLGAPATMAPSVIPSAAPAAATEASVATTVGEAAPPLATGPATAPAVTGSEATSMAGQQIAAPIAAAPTAAPVVAQPGAPATVSAPAALGSGVVRSVPAAPQSPEAARSAARKEKGEAVWAAMEQMGERFGMGAGVSAGDRIRLENKAATQTANFNMKMEAAGYKRNEQTGTWEAIPGKANPKKAATAQRQRDKAIADIAQERIELQRKAQSTFFSKETGATTLDPENLDFGPGSHETGTPVRSVKPDVHLPLSEPTRVTRPGEGTAQAGLVGRHGHQPNRGQDLISEHVQPGAQYEFVTNTPSGPIYDANQYGYDKTVLVPKAVADIKTHEGPRSDNKRTQALKDKAARGERIDIIQDILVPSLHQTFRAFDTARRRAVAAVTPAPQGAAPAAAAPPAQPEPPANAPSPAAVPPASPSPEPAATPRATTPAPEGNAPPMPAEALPAPAIPPELRGTGPAVAEPHSPETPPRPQGTGGSVPGGPEPGPAAPRTPSPEPIKAAVPGAAAAPALQTEKPLARPPERPPEAPGERPGAPLGEKAPEAPPGGKPSMPGETEHQPGKGGGALHGATQAVNQGAALVRAYDTFDEEKKRSGTLKATLLAGKTYLENTNIGAGAVANYQAKVRDGQQPAEAGLATAGELLAGFVVPGKGIDQAINAGANLADAADDHLKRAKPGDAASEGKATLRTGADFAAELTPSRMFMETIGAGARSYYDLYKAGRGDFHSVDKFGDDVVKGKLGMVLQPWGMAADFAGNLGSGEGAAKALDKTVAKTKGSTLEKIGSASGDAFYNLGQSEAAKSGKYGSAAQGWSMVSSTLSDHIAGKSWDQALEHAAAPGKDTALAKIGSAGGDLAWAAHEKAVEVVDKDIPALKAAAEEKVAEGKAAAAELRAEVQDKAAELKVRAADRWQQLKRGATSYLPW